jgi:hypothetical protein
VNTPLRDDRVLPETRWAALGLIPFLLGGFALLYLWPDDTARLFAWTIQPRFTPLLMGSGYLMGAYFFSQVYQAHAWHRVGAGFPAIATFATAMCLATLLHWDRFNHSHPAFWAWLVLYLVTPFLVVALYLRNKATDPGALEAHDTAIPTRVRRGLAGVAIANMTAGLILFVFPDFAAHLWPWHLTPLTAQVVGGWLAALPGVGGLMLALDGRWSSARILVRASVLWLTLLFFGILRAWSDFDFHNPLGLLWAIGIPIALVAVVAWHQYTQAQLQRLASAAPAADPAP